VGNGECPRNLLKRVNKVGRKTSNLVTVGIRNEVKVAKGSVGLWRLQRRQKKGGSSRKRRQLRTFLSFEGGEGE